MGFHEADAFALKTYPYAENHKVAVFFTRQAGIVRGVAHGARGLKSKFGAGLEPFSEVRLKYREKEGRELVQVTDCELVASRFDLGCDPEVAALFGYWGELLIEFFPAHQANDHAYRLVAAVLAAVDAGLDRDTLLRYFECWVLRLAGFLPDFSACSLCGRGFDRAESPGITRDGAPECGECGGASDVVLEPPLRDAIETVLRRSPARFAATPLDPRSFAQLGDITRRLIVHALEREPRAYAMYLQLRAMRVSIHG